MPAPEILLKSLAHLKNDLLEPLELQSNVLTEIILALSFLHSPFFSCNDLKFPPAFVSLI